MDVSHLLQFMKAVVMPSSNNLLLENIFEAVYNAMINAQGNVYQTGYGKYIDRKRIIEVVEQAIEKAEHCALDSFRILSEEQKKEFKANY